MNQLTCDICNCKAPLKDILVDTEVNSLCEKCWDSMLEEQA
jgi:hypothetical protein